MVRQFGALLVCTLFACGGLAESTDSTQVNMNIAAWGDSLTIGNGGATPYPTQLATLSGATIYNGGVGGDTSTQIATRMLADTAKYNWPIIIWAGRNNVTSGSVTLTDVASMVAAISPKNFIVLSILNSDISTEWVGAARYVMIANTNASLAATYGSRFLDVRAALVAAFDPGIPQDVIDNGHDVPPSSLRNVGDTLHLNTAGYAIVAQTIFKNFSLLSSGAAVGAAVGVSVGVSIGARVGVGSNT